MAVLCAFCSHANPRDAKFCNECGNTLRLRPCARCDAVNDVQSSQCHFCGAELDEGLRSTDPPRVDEPADAIRRDDSPAVDAAAKQIQTAETPALPLPEIRDQSASTSTTPSRSSKKPAANRWARPLPTFPRARPAQTQMASEMPQRSHLTGPYSEREATSVIRAVERSGGATAAFSTVSTGSEAKAVDARKPADGAVPLLSPADKGDAAAPPDVASSEGSRVSRRPPISRTLTAIVVVLVASLVAAEGFRRVSHIDRWADVPGVATVASALRARVPFLTASEAPARVQPITTAQPNVVQDALQNGSTPPPVPAPGSATSDVALPRVPAAPSEEAAAKLKVDAAVSPSVPTPPASTPSATSIAPSPPDGAATARAATNAPANEPTASSPPRKPRSAATVASNKTEKGGARARTDSTGVVTSSAPRSAGPSTATTASDARSAPAPNAAPCTQSVAALGLCNR